MTENVIQKSADQILEEIFSTLVSEPVTTVTTASDSSSFPCNENSTPKTDTTIVADGKPEDKEHLVISDKKKKKKDKKKSKKKKRKRDDGSDDESRKRFKEKKKKKDISSPVKEISKDSKKKHDAEVKSSEPTRTNKKDTQKDYAKSKSKPRTKEETKIHEKTAKDPSLSIGLESKKNDKSESNSLPKDGVKRDDKTESKLDTKIKKDGKIESKSYSKDGVKKNETIESNHDTKKKDSKLESKSYSKDGVKKNETIESNHDTKKKDDKLESKSYSKDGVKKNESIKSKPYTKIKKDEKFESKSYVKDGVKKSEKSESNPQSAKEEPKKPTRADSKSDVNVKPQLSARQNTDDRRTRRTETSESRRSHPSPKRRKSRSRSPIVRRPLLRRSRSRSPVRRARVRPRSRSPARSPPYHRKRSRSPTIQKRSATPPKSPRIDKAQLLEFARQNLKRMQETGSLPAGVTVPNQPTEVTPASTQFTGKTVAELTDYCKHLMADRSGDDDEKSGTKESDNQSTTFTRHPFQIKPRSDTIVMNIRNAVALPVRKPEERVVAQAQLKQQFPVSSGQQHLDLEWIPVTPSPVVKETNGNGGNKTTKAVTVSVAPTPRVSLPVVEPPAADIGAIVAKRISSIRKLQENQFDVQARMELEEAESMSQNWATFHHTNPMTGEPIPELINWSGAPQAWVKKDLFTSAAPVAGGVGMKLLQKMGWQPGEGLGRHGEGTLEPLSLDIKMDKKGLLSKEEMAGPARATSAVKLMNEFQGKHPVSILHELCTKHHWEPPVFEQVLDIGPDHLKHFLFKVAVNGIEYQACLASTTKKDAKAQSAAACLQALEPLFWNATAHT